MMLRTSDCISDPKLYYVALNRRFWRGCGWTRVGGSRCRWLCRCVVTSRSGAGTTGAPGSLGAQPWRRQSVWGRARGQEQVRKESDLSEALWSRCASFGLQAKHRLVGMYGRCDTQGYCPHQQTRKDGCKPTMENACKAPPPTSIQHKVTSHTDHPPLHSIKET